MPVVLVRQYISDFEIESRMGKEPMNLVSALKYEEFN